MECDIEEAEGDELLMASCAEPLLLSYLNQTYALVCEPPYSYSTNA